MRGILSKLPIFAIAAIGLTPTVLAADCNNIVGDGLESMKTADYEVLVNAITTNNFNPPLPTVFSLGPFQRQPFNSFGSAQLCIANDEIQTVKFDLDDVQIGVRNILEQCFEGAGGEGGKFTINGNESTGGSVILVVNPSGFDCP